MVETVTVLKNQKVLHWFLNLLAISGYCIYREKIWKIYIVIMVTFGLSVLGVLVYSMFFYFDEMTTFAVIFHHAVLIIDMQAGIIFAYLNRNLLRRLITDMTTSYDYGSSIVSRFPEDLQGKRALAMEKTFKYLVVTLLYMEINAMLFGLVEKHAENVEFILLFPCWFPFDLKYLPYHIIAYVWELIVFACIGLSSFGVLAYVYLIYSHLTTQITLLNFAIDRSKDRAYEKVNIAKNNSNSFSDEKNVFKNRLRSSYIKGTKQCVKHHLLIIEYYTRAKEIFKMVYFLVFATGLFVCTATGFVLITDNTSVKIKFVGVTVVQLLCLFIFCWFGQKITFEGERIRLSIYGIEWYELPKECQSSFKLMVERSLKPFQFTSYIGQRADLRSYMSMLHASYSYFNLILATQQIQ